MINILDWLLEKMQIIDEDADGMEEEAQPDTPEKSWLGFGFRKKEKIPGKESHVYFKNVQIYADCRLLIDHYRLGDACIFLLEPKDGQDVNEMMNYICGGIYALDGEIENIGENVFMTALKGMDTQSNYERREKL